jgi:hypothetical protein
MTKSEEGLMSRLRIFPSLVAIALAFGVSAAGSARADLTFNFLPTNTFSGTAPAGTLTATFSDVGTNQVQLVISSNLASGENVQANNGFYFNFNPAKAPAELAKLTFALTSFGPPGSPFSQQANVAQGEDAFKADGDGNYDINMT